MQQNSSQCVLLNLYGSTEVMADVTYELFDSMASIRAQKVFEGRVSIGYPIDNTTVEIINMNEQGIGEMVIAGNSVTNGYYRNSTNQTEMVEERFIRGVDDQLS
jgi:non-ribosomal peptide synthetase component F